MPASYSTAMCGCCRRARIARSRAMRSVKPWSTHSARGNLSAAVRCMTPSARCANQTSPMPPSASRRCNRHGPMRSPCRSRRIAASASAATLATALGVAPLPASGSSACESNSSSSVRRWASPSPRRIEPRAPVARRRAPDRARAARSGGSSPWSRAWRAAGSSGVAIQPKRRNRRDGESDTSQRWSATDRSSRARCQSRPTVRTVTPSASAISASVMPPK